MGSGPSVTWNAEADSPSGNGLKSVVTDPVHIDDFSTERFWLIFEKRVRMREKLAYEKSYQSQGLADGGIVGISSYDIPFAGELRTYTVFYFYPKKDELQFHYYHTDSTMKKKLSTSTLKLHHDPLRMEYWVEELAVRHSGPFLKAVLNEIVKKLGASAEVTENAPSITDSGETSVVTGPLDGACTTPDAYLDWSKQSLESSGAVLQPDGKMLEETKSWFAPAVYRTYSFDTANNLILSHEYGIDSTCAPTSHASTTYTKVHKDPFRLEVWNITEHARRANEGVKTIIEKIMEDVMAHYLKEDS